MKHWTGPPGGSARRTPAVQIAWRRRIGGAGAPSTRRSSPQPYVLDRGRHRRYDRPVATSQGSPERGDER